MYSCACSLSSHPVGLYPVMTCEYSQGENGSGRTALMWASCRGHADTVRVLVELGASVEAVDNVNIHAHALACTGCIQHVSGIRRRMIIIMSHAYACRCIYMHSYIHVYSYLSYTYVCIYICIYIYVYIHTYAHAHPHTKIYRRVTLSCRQVKHAIILFYLLLFFYSQSDHPVFFLP